MAEGNIQMTCPWCGGNEIQHDIKRVITAPYLAVELGDTNIPMASMANYSECKCGLVFQEHRQSDEWYEWFYSSGTYRQTLGISQEEMDADEQRRADDLVKWLSVFNKINFNHHCDVGASRGYLSTQMKHKFDCDSSVLDLNKEYSQLPEYIQTRICVSTDFISAIHVLEHVTDPIKELTTWASMTSKYLLIEVPGLNTIGGPLRFAHLYYFPPELLKAKIIELGFDIMAMETEPNTRILAEKRLTNNK